MVKSITKQKQELIQRSRYTFVIIINTLSTSCHLLRQSMQNWESFMSNSHKWMGNFIHRGNMGSMMYRTSRLMQDFTPQSLTLFKNSLLLVQQVRSYNLHLIQKEDIWETKNQFKNEVSRIILENNLECKSMEELEFLVILKVKQMIDKVLPKPGYVDGPWKIYAERVGRSA